VHGGILARRDLPEHLATIEQHGIPTIDLVCVNLYPFAATIAKAGVTLEDAIENIDIGGPAMVRSSAKNYAGVAIVTDPEDYAPLLAEMKANAGALQLATRFGLAKKAFTHTARYDSMIANWLTGLDEGAEAKPAEAAPVPAIFPAKLQLAFDRTEILRYGENSHQSAAFYRETNPVAGSIAAYTPVAGQGTVLQQHRRLRCGLGMRQVFRRPGLRHRQARQPVRRGHRRHLLGAYEKSFKTDSTSAFGGIIAFNGEVGIDVVNAMNERKHFVEVLIAPSFTAEAKAALASKANLRVLVVPISRVLNTLEFKRVGGGLLVQTPDDFTAQASGLKIVTKIQPTAQQIEDLLFAERVAKFVKSNAIVFCGNGMTLGVGAGQMSRVDSTKIASIKAQHAGLDLNGSVVASDAFFPFRDGVDVLAAAGAKAVIQPGGSMRDEEVIAAADEHGLAMVFTGARHFRH
jgi:phosphoribosylaminoimidazolecarboxamide formyltransferase/IMP cyclohydrolase